MWTRFWSEWCIPFWMFNILYWPPLTELRLSKTLKGKWSNLEGLLSTQRLAWQASRDDTECYAWLYLLLYLQTFWTCFFILANLGTIVHVGKLTCCFVRSFGANGCKWVFLQKRLFGGFLQTAPFYTCLLDFSAVFWREQLLLQKRFCGCEYWCTKARNRCSWGVLYISGHASTKCWKEQAFWCEMLRDAAAKIVFALFCAHERAKQVPHQHHHL